TRLNASGWFVRRHIDCRFPERVKPKARAASASMNRMRILLQQKETGLYFKDIDSWVRTSAQAMDFVSSTSAIDFCVVNKLSAVQLVLKVDEQQYDIVLPVRPLQDFGAECASGTA